jgi:hypothetical protein
MPDLLQQTVIQQMPFAIVAFDDTQKSVSGTTETEIKYTRFANTVIKWTQMMIVATLWVSGGTGYLKIYIDSETSPRLQFSTTSTSETRFQDTFSIGDLSAGIHTVHVKLVNSGSYVTYNKLLEVYVR